MPEKRPLVLFDVMGTLIANGKFSFERCACVVHACKTRGAEVAIWSSMDFFDLPTQVLQLADHVFSKHDPPEIDWGRTIVVDDEELALRLAKRRGARVVHAHRIDTVINLLDLERITPEFSAEPCPAT
jgi:hypothetical protein